MSLLRRRFGGPARLLRRGYGGPARVLLLAAAASVGALAVGILAGLGGAFAFTLFTGGAMPVVSALIALAGAAALIGGSVRVLLVAWPTRLAWEDDDVFGELIRSELGPRAWGPHG